MNKITLIIIVLFTFIMVNAQNVNSNVQDTLKNEIKQGFYQENAGKLVSSGYYVDNKKQGNWVTVSANGLINKIEYYEDGKKN
ncbi:MAG: hypothetical protein KAT33_06690, partial [Bacteroidales bacterium]|nr:hypothetical protein [Bacteroidales bacterium]